MKKGTKQTSGMVVVDPDGRWIMTVRHPTNGEIHSWDHEWIKHSIRAHDGRIACACTEILPDSECSDGPHAVDFAMGHPQMPSKEGNIVVASYESGGEILRFLNGAWKVIGHQPARATKQ